MASTTIRSVTILGAPAIGAFENLVLERPQGPSPSGDFGA
jgi:hypothetical protein